MCPLETNPKSNPETNAETRYLAVLKKYWGYDSFRSIQLDIITSIGSGRDTLGLMPTGGGKSITFQVPALSQEGVCIVVTPLVALMKDQVYGLRQKGILAHAIHSALRHDEVLAAYDNCVVGACKFLYVSPERLQNELFLAKVFQMNVTMIVIDEAHCISQWGYDFRPSYLRIADFRAQLPHVPVLALTATATPRVVDDIMDQLHFRERNCFKMSFERSNIAYVVRRTEAKEQQMLHILQRVPGSAIVYVRSRRRTKEVCDMLRAAGLSADYFHAGLDPREKDRKQEAWTKGDIRVIVCTNAFGMGIDKPDVRVVIHIEPPESLEAYYQEAGRAGRDGQKSYAVFLWSAPDAARLRRNVTNSFPPLDYVVGVYNSVCNSRSIGVGMGGGHAEEFDVQKFCYDSGRQLAQTISALAILSRAEYLHFEPNLDLASRVMFLVERHRLYAVEEAYPHLSATIKGLLRIYTGLFMDYAVINEGEVARMSGQTRQQVYERLLELGRLGIISYNPQKHTSFMTWLQDRVHEKYMVFPPSVYDDRLADARKRMDSVINYCTTDGKCRSRLLLEYFGQTDAPNCGQCDVCLAHNKVETMSVATYEAIVRAVVCRLSAHGPTRYNDLCAAACEDINMACGQEAAAGTDSAANNVAGNAITCSPRDVAVVLRQMIDDQQIAADVRNIYSLKNT